MNADYYNKKIYRKQFFFLQNLHKAHINLIEYSLSLENFVQNIRNLI